MWSSCELCGVAEALHAVWLTHLRNYRILAEVLEDYVESWVDGPCYYNNSNKRGTSTTLKPPTLVASQSLFKVSEKMTEPLKPPASAAAYYVMTHHSKLGNLNPAEIDALRGTVSEKEKKSCIEEHKKVHTDFVRKLEIFIRTLNPDELRSYCTIMRNRARDQEEEVKESCDEERNDEERML